MLRGLRGRRETRADRKVKKQTNKQKNWVDES